jgi:hypothetical protein
MVRTLTWIMAVQSPDFPLDQNAQTPVKGLRGSLRRITPKATMISIRLIILLNTQRVTWMRSPTLTQRVALLNLTHWTQTGMNILSLSVMMSMIQGNHIIVPILLAGSSGVLLSLLPCTHKVSFLFFCYLHPWVKLKGESVVIPTDSGEIMFVTIIFRQSWFL